MIFARAPLLSLAQQARAAAACAAQLRAASASLTPRKAAIVERANLQRLALLRRMASKDNRSSRELCEHVMAELNVSTLVASESSVNHLLYDLRDRGWAAAHIPATREGIRVGTGRVNRWRITHLGRAALADLAASLTESATETPTGAH